MQRLQRRLHELQRECRQLCKALAGTQQQLAARSKRPNSAWAAGKLEQHPGAAGANVLQGAQALAGQGLG